MPLYIIWYISTVYTRYVTFEYNLMHQASSVIINSHGIGGTYTSASGRKSRDEIPYTLTLKADHMIAVPGSKVKFVSRVHLVGRILHIC